MKAIVRKSVVIDYAPRSHFEAFDKRRQRWACMVCHRRAGKTVASINDAIKRAFVENKPDALRFRGPVPPAGKRCRMDVPEEILRAATGRRSCRDLLPREVLRLAVRP